MLMPEGVYVFNVLLMSLCNSGDLFMSALNLLLSHLTGMTRIANDILVYVIMQDEHDHNVIAFLKTCLQIDLHLNPEKVRINCAEIPFFGMLLMKDGIKLQTLKRWRK